MFSIMYTNVMITFLPKELHPYFFIYCLNNKNKQELYIQHGNPTFKIIYLSILIWILNYTQGLP